MNIIRRTLATLHIEDTVLLRLDMLQRGYGSLYSIPSCFLAPGQRALDFGAVLLRLDRLDAK